MSPKPQALFLVLGREGWPLEAKLCWSKPESQLSGSSVLLRKAIIRVITIAAVAAHLWVVIMGLTLKNLLHTFSGLILKATLCGRWCVVSLLYRCRMGDQKSRSVIWRQLAGKQRGSDPVGFLTPASSMPNCPFFYMGWNQDQRKWVTFTGSLGRLAANVGLLLSSDFFARSWHHTAPARA